MVSTSTSPGSTPTVDRGSTTAGWSSLVGSPDGTRLWTLTDNYARLLRVVVDADPATGFMTAVHSVQNATFAIRTPSDPSASASSASPRRAPSTSRRASTSSLYVHDPGPAAGGADPDSNPREKDTDANLHHPAVDDGSDDATNELEDFVVGVEDSWELPANNLIRFRDGRKKAWTDLPVADAALDACDANLGPESLIWLPPAISTTSRAGSTPTISADRATLVTFCDADGDLKPDVVRGCVRRLRRRSRRRRSPRRNIPSRRRKRLRFIRCHRHPRRRARALPVPLLHVPTGLEGKFGRTGDHHRERWRVRRPSTTSKPRGHRRRAVVGEVERRGENAR